MFFHVSGQTTDYNKLMNSVQDYVASIRVNVLILRSTNGVSHIQLYDLIQ